MVLKDYIQITEETLPITAISNLIRVCNDLDFQTGKTIGQDLGEVDEQDARIVKLRPLNRFEKSKTNVHWYNLIGSVIKNGHAQYIQKFPEAKVKQMVDISILKYGVGGKYDWHTDHAAEVPRTLSAILFLNNSYEGGELKFRSPLSDEELTVKPGPGKLVMWPSNFMFPHAVAPVTKGERLVVVGWML